MRSETLEGVPPTAPRAALASTAALALYAALLLAACASLAPKKEWVRAEVPAASEQVLFEVTRLTLETQGFHVLSDGFDPVKRSLQSTWVADLHPFKGHGYRERVHVSYQPLGPGRIEISVRVEHQSNNNIARPLDYEYADWKPAPDHAARAGIVLQQLRMRLGGALDLRAGGAR